VYQTSSPIGSQEVALSYIEVGDPWATRCLSKARKPWLLTRNRW